MSPGQFVPALERLGLTRLFDVAVMRDVLERLRSSPEICLGCKVSALSAVNDLWWQDVQQMLLLDPGLASRLVIEVTETVGFPNAPRAQAFIESFRRMGCSTATDNFGAGCNSSPTMMRTKPDPIKIDTRLVP